VQYIDLKNTFVVDMYGVRLRFEDKSVDDESRVTRWVDPLAPGVRAAKEKSAIHTSDFRTTVHKPAKREIPVEKVTYRYLGLYFCASSLFRDQEDLDMRQFPRTFHHYLTLFSSLATGLLIPSTFLRHSCCSDGIDITD
jgi:hypothetical protein